MPEPNRTQAADGFYSSDAYVDNLLDYLKERKSDNELAEKPFFAYLPFAAPHWPLQCSKEDRDMYKGQYDDGPDALRLRRLQNMKNLGIVEQDVEPYPVVAGEVPEWDTMSLEEQALSAGAMETYAGMVTA